MPQGAVHIIVNPVSGQGHDSGFLSELVRHLGLRGFSPKVEPTERAGHAKDLAHSVPDNAHCIVSIGGDGTHREVLSGLVGRPVPVCVVSSGTENVMAKTFGLLSNLKATLQRIQTRRIAAVDIGMANAHPFVLFSGIGFDAAVTQEVHAKRQGRILRDSYYATIVRLLWRYHWPPIAVTVDGRPLADDAGMVLVANTPVYADRLRLAPGALGDDGLLDVVAFRARSRWQLLEMFAAARLGRHLDHPRVAHAKGKQIEVTCGSEPVPAQIDGDAMMTTPVTYTVLPRAVRLLV
ncbi:MAG: diacylglycerol kinase family lipid kinase [Planctomycetota bacterium]|nr:diacylglycerol kinase family lipid kinase [Planctomycetota bacterium]